METPKVYSHGAMVAAALLGGPLAASVLMWRNARRLGQERQAPLFLIAGVGLTLAITGLAFTNAPNSVFEFIHGSVALGVHQLAKHLAPRLEAHRAQGGGLVPWWRVALTTLGCLALCLGMIAVIEMARPEDKVVADQLEVFYQDGATEAQAHAVADGLRAMDVGAAHPASVQLRRSGKGFQVRLMVDPDKVKDVDDTIIGDLLSAGPLGGKPVDLIWCEGDFDHPIKHFSTTTARTLLFTENGAVLSRDGVDPALARDLGEAQAFGGEAIEVLESNGQLAINVSTNSAAQLELAAAALTPPSPKLRALLGKRSLEVRLCANGWKTQRTIRIAPAS